MKYSLLLFLAILLGSCSDSRPLKIPKKARLQGVKEYVDFSQLEPYFHKNNDTTYLINFWATTCPPCIKEIPYFEKLSKAFKEEKLEFLLINTDGKRHFESRLFPFLEKKKINLPVVALTDPNANVWTAAVNKDWYGALPYTIIYRNEDRKYYFGAFENYAEIKNEVQLFLDK